MCRIERTMHTLLGVVNKVNLTARKLPATGPVKAEVVPKAQKAVATALPLTIMLVS